MANNGSLKSTIAVSLTNYLDAGAIVAGASGLTLWKEYLDLTEMHLGWLNFISANCLGAAIGAIIGGFLADKFGRKFIYTYNLLVYMLGVVLVMLSVNFPMLLTGFLITGISVGIGVPASWTYISESSEINNRGRNICISQMSWGFGPMIILLLGMLFADYFPKATEKIKKPFSIFSIAVFIVMVLGMFIPNWQLFIKYIIFIFILVMIHNACAFATGFTGASLMKLPVRDRRSITIEVGIQNSGLGLTLLLNPAIFKPEIWNNPETGIMFGGMLFVTAWWGIWHIISGLTIASLFRRKPLPEE